MNRLSITLCVHMVLFIDLSEVAQQATCCASLPVTCAVAKLVGIEIGLFATAVLVYAVLICRSHVHCVEVPPTRTPEKGCSRDVAGVHASLGETLDSTSKDLQDVGLCVVDSVSCNNHKTNAARPSLCMWTFVFLTLIVSTVIVQLTLTVQNKFDTVSDELEKLAFNTSSEFHTEECKRISPLLLHHNVADAPDLNKHLRCQHMNMQTMLSIDMMGSQSLVPKTDEIAKTLEVLIQSCGAISKKISALHKWMSHSDVAASTAVAVLEELSEFELPFQTARAILEQFLRLVDKLSAEELAKANVSIDHILGLSDAAQDCLLTAVNEARSFASRFGALDCSSDLLSGIESLTLGFAEGTQHADTAFALGMLLSEINVASSSVPCFKGVSHDDDFVLDAQKTVVPRGILKAEALLAKAHEGTWEEEKVQRGATRAWRMSVHADFLAEQTYHAAAEWRYRSAASIALQHQHPHLASLSLASLSHMLYSLGRNREALEATNEALAHSDEPVALFVQTSVSLSLGRFDTHDAVTAAANKLKGLAGRMPSEDLESARVELVHDLAKWEHRSTSNWRSCLSDADSAQALICLIGRASFKQTT